MILENDASRLESSNPAKTESLAHCGRAVRLIDIGPMKQFRGSHPFSCEKTVRRKLSKVSVARSSANYQLPPLGPSDASTCPRRSVRPAAGSCPR
eukprot:1469871-Prymnesium_polylepis.1